MKWPTVSRELYAAAVEARDKAEARYDALLVEHRNFIALVAERTAPRAPTQPLTPSKPDPVAGAIIARAGTNLALRAHLVSFAAEQRALQKTDREIVAAIYHQTVQADPKAADRQDAENVVGALLDAGF